MKKIKISFGIADTIDSSVERAEDLWPEEKIPQREPDSNQYIFQITNNMKDEENWFKEITEDLYKNYYVYLFYTSEREEDLRNNMFAIYANHCYKKHKKIPVEFNTFNCWLNKYILNRAILTEGGCVINTYSDYIFGRNSLKFTYLELEAIERLVDKEKFFNKQEELIDNIFKCFKLRWEIERAKTDIIISSLGTSIFEAIVNELYIKFEKNKTVVLFDNTLYEFKDDEIMKQELQKQLENNRIEDETEEENKKENDSMNMDPFKEIEFVLNKINKIDELLVDAGLEEYNNKPAREFAYLYWKIRDHFITKGKEYDPILVKLNDEEIVLSCFKEFDLRFKGKTIFRDTMEEIYNLDVLLYEIEKERISLSEEAKEKEEKAKKHFFQFLDEENRSNFMNHQYVVLESEKNTYIIHKLKRYNNILKISKETQEKRALCICPKEHRVNEFDVFTTIVMLLQSGREDYLLNLANEYPLLELDEEIVEQILGNKKIA